MSDSVLKALGILNEALALDADAITALVNVRVDCNSQISAHPTIQVNAYDGIAKIGVLGIINGIIGDSPTGVIGAKGQMDVATGRFTQIREFVDLRDGKVDVIA
ncbi:MAG: hypothetical protein HQ503_08310 [Rhodospirillales bacterium]|nr:hypothetical protein [Rhodospirillales bacterium]